MPSPSSLPGPRLSRADLEGIAHGPVSEFFGAAFAPQDAYDRVVRMPCPPLLLADRVLGIEGPPMVQGKGSIWTETDVTEESWYLHDGHMPAGIMIESGQADLLLASWQGVDVRHNHGERIYRLLGCTLTYHDGLPVPGDTLRYDIHIDGHAKLGDIRMFFFHYDCRIRGEKRLSVRQGQAGFFSDAELAASGGVLWDAETAEVDLSGPHEKPAVRCTKSSFSRAELEALAEGRVVECFGPGFERAHTHTGTPRPAGGRFLFFDRVEVFDPEGGPWKRGYLRAEQDIRPDLWFFDGHFHNDPCMPGTLMFEGCLQAMSVYLAGLGYTLRRDGWRFEPAKGQDFLLRCRGQVVPTSKKLTYELFIQEVGLHPRPYVKAQVMCTVDGLKCFHADPLVVEMVPDWPMSRMKDLPTVAEKPCEYDYRSLLACAWGRPTEAFGSMYVPFDSERHVARLPGPPYHFMSRVLKANGEKAGMKVGSSVEVEYDVPPDAWYFDANGCRTMPYAVLLEAALQPCGWLASWLGCALTTDGDVLFRNLDGTGIQHVEVLPESGTLTTRVKNTGISKSAGMIIVSFQVEMEMAGRPLYSMKTVFGFFPPAAFENQVGVGSTPEERARMAAPSDFLVDLTTQDERWFGGTLRLPEPELLMIDRVTAHDGDWWRAEKDISAEEWFFKAHFYSDPVQPGSLGVEALIQLLQFAMLHEGVGAGMTAPRFEAIATGEAMTWKYRGQVIPENKLVQTEVHVTRREGTTWWAEAHVWVDGKRIYSCTNMGMRVVEGGTPRPRGKRAEPKEADPGLVLPVPVDHCPTYVLPALPMTGMAMVALSGLGTAALKEGQALRWLAFPDGPRRVSVKRDGDRVTLATEEGPFFTARAASPEEPPPPPVLVGGVPGEDGAALYASGRLFHGPGFHVVERVLARGDNGATLLLRPAPPDVLLDGATHGVAHDRPEEWVPGLAPGQVAYPLKLVRLALFGAPPVGSVRCEVRVLGKLEIGAWFYEGERLAAHYVLQEVLLPKGRLGAVEPAARRDFLRGAWVPGVSLSRVEGDRASLTAAEVKGSDWLPGTVARVFGADTPGEIAARELAAARLHVHPRALVADGERLSDPHHPLRTVRARRLADGAEVVHEAPLAAVIEGWRARLGGGAWPGEDVIARLAERFFADLVVVDPAAIAALAGRPSLWLANHENYVESVLFTTVAAGLAGAPMRALAKVEHRALWLGRLHDLLCHYPGHEQGDRIAWFDQADPASLPGLARAVLAQGPLLVHVEGTRQTTPGQRVEKISSLWVDLALETGVPIVPVAFRGGLTADGARHDLPPGPQTHWVGRPIAPATLAALPYAERRRAVADAIDALGLDTPACAGVARPVADTFAEAFAGLGGEGPWWDSLRALG